MKVRFVPSLAAVACLLATTAFADDQTDRWIAKARAALGTEEALDAINSVRFIGTVETVEKVPDKADPTKTVDQTVRLAIDIVFAKPYRELYVLRSDKVTETTALDDYDGWLKRVEAGHEDQWQLRLLSPAQIRQLRASTWENLAFYRGIEKRGGKVEFKGDAEVDGKPCVVLVFEHSDAITYTRYFEKSSGLLLKTTTETTEIREQGSVVVNGVRFPKVLLNKPINQPLATITFDSIKVNEPVSAAQFVMPEVPADAVPTGVPLR
ncbi:MAG TPA: hypothetical protein VHD32_12355 [Candidatus Didemnitutus sp.]|nr:hypothetical protein [Candidatus Didemnitutus sp.]